MILLDTHVWVWWSVESERLSPRHRELIDVAEPDGIRVSVFSFWEVAMLATKGSRVDLAGLTVDQWFGRVLQVPTLHVLPLTPQILLESTRLPEPFHSDPADRIIVATARSHGATLLTQDRKILDYPHVRTSGPTSPVPRTGEMG
jgi:PIN domain nuclease of toxin-antitoxin system